MSLYHTMLVYKVDNTNIQNHIEIINSIIFSSQYTVSLTVFNCRFRADVEPIIDNSYHACVIILLLTP